MLTVWRSGFGAVAVTLAAVALVVLDTLDEPLRRWWLDHALTTDVAAGLLVLLITVLVVDQVVGLRRARDRSRAVAAQVALIFRQALRSASALLAALEGSGERDDAAAEIRSYMVMLLVSAPVLIEARISRTFLEQAQHLGGEMIRLSTRLGRASDPVAVARARLNDAVSRLRAASEPLLSVLHLDERMLRAEDDGA
jgi:hypothetical protein